MRGNTRSMVQSACQRRAGATEGELSNCLQLQPPPAAHTHLHPSPKLHLPWVNAKHSSALLYFF